MFVSQVQSFLEKNQRETQMTPLDRGEMGGVSTQEPEDKPPFPGKEAVEEERSNSPCNLDAKRTVESEGEEVEQPGNLLTCLEIPDFFLSDAPEVNSGKYSITQMILMIYVFVFSKKIIILVQIGAV